MDACFFLDIVDNIGDGFSDRIFSADTANKIPKYHSPVTLNRSVVRSQALDYSHTPSCVESQADFKLYNKSGDELFGIEGTKYSPYSLSPDYTSSEDEPCLTLTIPPIS